MANGKLLKGFINLSKCKNPAYLKETKTGDIGVWVSIWLNEEPDKFGNTMSIQLNQSKEQRAANEPKVYICNARPNEEVQVNTDPISEEETKPIDNVTSGDTLEDLPF